VPIENGELVLDPWPTTVKNLKFGSDDPTTYPTISDEYELKRQVVELLEYIRGVGAGEIRTLEIRHGLPFSMEVELAGPRLPPRETAVAEVNLDLAFPAIRLLARRKAGAFVRRFHLSIDEREDIESELILHCVHRWAQFDECRSSARTFAAIVMDREVISIMRYRLAQARQRRDLPELCGGPEAQLRCHFCIDVDRALAPLPQAVRQTASALASLSTGDAARRLGCSRQMVNRRKIQIRNALLAAGITATYFHSQGLQSWPRIFATKRRGT